MTNEYSSHHTGGSDGDGDSACSQETDQHKNASSRDGDGSEERDHGIDGQGGSDDQAAEKEGRQGRGVPKSKSGSGTGTETGLQPCGMADDGSGMQPLEYNNMQRGRQHSQFNSGRVLQKVCSH